MGGRTDRGDPGGRGAPPGQPEAGNVEHISRDAVQKEARPLFDVNTLQHLPDGFAVMTGLGVARLAFSSPLHVDRREIPLKTFPVLAKTDPLARSTVGGRAAAAG
ncbi:hypothetical protein [Klebsiella pneumoniae]|uniref:hypothetical protein n=1 Tax=Klebsiella pneumoniae TaxID=573 RepID=UPI00351AA040